MNDLISRQAAIEAIMGEPTDAHYPSWYAERLAQLPSPQPERTCVNCDRRTRCPIGEHYALPKDDFCYLWEKRNVTE